MPRYIVERTFVTGPELRRGAGDAESRLEVIERNAEEGVTWLHSYVSEDHGTEFCFCEAPSPEAIRRVAARCRFPIDRITQVRVLDPYGYP